MRIENLFQSILHYISFDYMHEVVMTGMTDCASGGITSVIKMMIKISIWENIIV